ncbi:DUF927 domain-containing protein [uncultured Thiodictyon sp.]|uniref:DUF927 domain-containing protein n=1 Tax=uncultured Thiodictyon sp. TaxID=1846217 RepID=UPI0025FD92D7|nr:DUF927 domain-containing protein [uncultured Thiodictyon sp.]
MTNTTERPPGPPPTPRALKAAIDPFAFYVREIEHAPALKVNDKGWSQLFPCPLHTDHDGSFAVSAKTGAYHCFGCGAKGGSVIDFAMAYDRLDLDQARAALSERYGVQCEPSPAKSNPKATEPTAPAPEPTPTVLAPIPAEALAMRPTTAGKLGEPSATWEYRDSDGQPVAYVLRFDHPDGRKEFRPQTWDGTRWTWKAPAVPRPLYHLNLLAARPGAPVLIAEGEKAADAVAVLVPDLVATTTMNGAQSPAKSDLSPLAGRHVRIWPDHDEPGAQYARTVSALTYAAGAASVEVLDLSSLADELPPGWDAADALSDGWTADRLAVAKWAKIANPFVISEGTGGTQGTALIREAVLGSPTGEPRGNPGEPGQGTAKETARTKPPVDRPGFDVHEDWTGFGPPGLYWHGYKGKGDEVEDVDQWICSPLYADAIAHGEHDADYGLLLRFQNACGRWREWSMPMRLLKGSGEELRGELLDLGVRIDPVSHRLLNQCLMSRHPKRRVLAATSTGWHGDGSIFVLPDRIIGSGEVRYQSEHAQHDAFSMGGTADGWREAIAARCVDNPMLVFSVAAALAGPLLAKVHRVGCGFHFVGDSSTGKSTLLTAGASCWGGAGFIRTWKATGNGLEGVAAALTDTALVLDEISEADPREIGSIVYSIGNGTGKSRGARTGGARAVQRWRVVLLSSGERTLTATMAEGGKAAKAGQEARLLDVPCARRLGVFDTLHDLADGRALSDALRTAAAVHYGHAGPAFVARIIADAKDWGDLYAKTSALPQFAADNELEGRASGAFALVALAGELAIEWGIVPWSEGDALAAAVGAFAAWKTNRPKGHTETRQVLQSVADFIAAHGDARFSSLASEGDTRQPVTRDRAGWWKDTTAGRVYLFTPGGLREAAPGFDFRRVLEALDGSKWIVERDDGKRSKKVKVQGRSQGLYAIAPQEDAA